MQLLTAQHPGFARAFEHIAKTDKNTHPLLMSYISTVPSSKDLYDGQPHDRIAKAIAALLTKSEFKLIGLEGDYGSGKSTVIELLRGKLPLHHFFIYDTWSHQEDLQRRAFLEELTDDLILHQIIEPGSWKDDLQILLGKKRNTSTKTVPKFDIAHYLILATAIGLMISKPISDIFIEQKHPVWRLLAQYAPAIALLIVWAIAVDYFPQYRSLSNILTFYRQTENEKATLEIINEMEPSAAQFRQWLTKISENINDDKRVIIVFDNMDRLPSGKVNALWSALQTFISEVQSHYPKIDFIVPFDRQHIGKAFSNKEDSDEIAQHYISKTFPVIFHIPPPSFTAWKSLFRSKISRAIPGILDPEHELIETVFEIHIRPVTPRNVISFINELVTLKSIWGEQIPIRYMALYAATRKEILAGGPESILSRNFANKTSMYFQNDNTLMQCIAALHYNVPLDQASHVLLYAEIQSTLQNRNIPHIKTLYEHPDFMTIFNRIIRSNDSAIEDKVICIYEIEEYQLIPDAKKALANLWPVLSNKEMTRSAFPLELQSYQTLLLKKVVPDNPTHPLIQHLLKGFHESTNPSAAAYFQALSRLDQTLQQISPQLSVQKLVKPKNVHSLYFVEYVKAAKESYNEYGVFTDRDALDIFLQDETNNFSHHFQILPFITNTYELPKLLAKVASMLSDDGTNQMLLYPALMTYKSLTKQRPITVPFTPDRIYTILNIPPADIRLVHELWACKIALGNAYKDEFPKFTTNMFAPEGEGVNLASIVEDYKRLDDIIIDELATEGHPNAEIIRQIIWGANKASKVDIRKVLPRALEISARFDLSPEDFLKALEIWYQNSVHSLDRSYIESLSPNEQGFKFFESFANREGKLASDLLVAAQDYISSRTEPAWVEAFGKNAEGFLFSFTAAMSKYKIIDGLPIAALNPFYKLAINLAEKGLPAAVKDNFYNLYNNTPHTFRKKLATEIRDHLINKHSKDPSSYSHFEEAMRLDANLKEKADEVTTVILQPLLKFNSIIDLLLTQKEFYLNLLNTASEIARSQIVDSIRNALENEPGKQPLSQLEEYLNHNLYSPIEILSAIYMSPDDHGQSQNVINLVSDHVQNKKLMHFRVTNDSMGGDPAPGSVKRLYVDYIYEGQKYSRGWNENQFWRFPYSALQY